MIYILPEQQIMPAETNIATPANSRPSGFVSIGFSFNMAIIKTLPGFANSLAYRIDEMKAFEILGTIAGDDTILVIGREGISRPDLVQSLRPVIG
jgi:transcriptional regulator of arginine metabolism